ncbi:MAG: lysophospholipase [Phycisphaerae bacterium]|nr:lysophospholipase [Phycisphaerae bacterium]
MKHIFCTISVLAAIAAVSGCGNTRIIEAQTLLRNKIEMGLYPTDKLLQSKAIDLHRTFTMPDKVEIDAWAINAKKSPVAGTVILLHGTGQCKWNYLGIGKNLAKRGYDVVLIDLRCHGKSTGKYITCGAKEKQDVKTVVDTLIREKKIAAKPLYVFGVTFGAATALQYAAIEPNVAGVVAMAPWKDTVTKARRDVGMLMEEKEFSAVLDDVGKIADFDPRATSAAKAAAKLKCPVYLIHGKADLVVPVSDSEAIFAVLTGPKELKLISPGPEQLLVGMAWETWVPDQIEKLQKLEKQEPGKTVKQEPGTKEPGKTEKQKP